MDITKPIPAIQTETYEELQQRLDKWINWYEESVRQLNEDARHQIEIAQRRANEAQQRLDSHNCANAIGYWKERYYVLDALLVQIGKLLEASY